MSQHDFNIANQGFPATRSDINNALAALASTSSGTSEPSTTYANQFWYDTTNNLLKFRNEANSAWITLAYLDQATNEWEIRSAVIQAVDSAGISLKTDDGTTRVTIQDDGDVAFDTDTLFVDAANDRVGIGTSSPQEDLHITSTLPTLRMEDSDDASYGEILYNVGSGGLLIRSDVGNTAGSSSNIIMQVDGTEAMRIDSSGNILAGRTSAIGTASSHIFQATSDVAALNAYTATTTTGRNVFNVRSDVGGAETIVGAVEANGDFQSATNSYGSTSDERIKQDIVDSGSQYEDVKNVRLRKYKLKAHVETMGADAPEQLGVVAQELEAAGMSGLVKTDPDTGIKSVRYSVMYLKALGALQEAITKIEDLETRVAALESA